jgi:molybdate transport system substrate-binding protein
MKSWRVHFLSLIGAASLALAGTVGAQENHGQELRVFAAASLSQVLGELSASWERASGVPVKLSFAASSALARQIEAGATADVFVSADQEWMDYLDSRGLVRQDTRRNLVGNRLVLIAPANSGTTLAVAPGFKLAPALAGGRLAMADPDTVPAGRYARAALIHLGVWESVSERLARAENVRTALTYVARGESPLGIVYSTDAQIEPKVRVLATFPDSSHAPITYPAAATAQASTPAVAYLEYLSSAPAAVVWKRYGFRELGK